MGQWKGIVNRAFTTEEFDDYCHGLRWTAWRPSMIVLHNTAIPSLAQRPHGWTEQHMKDLVPWYRDEQKDKAGRVIKGPWKAGPHLFIDDSRIWVFTPLTVSGTHSPTWNKFAIGVEMLGNYAVEDFDKGRGALVRDNAVAAIATLCAVLGLDPWKMRLHKEDPLTTHACPGKDVTKGDVIQRVVRLIVVRHGGEHAAQAASA